MKIFPTIQHSFEIDDGMCNIVNALNALPGIVTVYSCNGHTTQSPKVYFKMYQTYRNEGLFFLTHCLDPNHWRFGDEWTLSVSIRKFQDRSLSTEFLLTCRQKGYRAEHQITSLCKNMEQHLNNAEFVSEFNINLDKFVVAET